MVALAMPVVVVVLVVILVVLVLFVVVVFQMAINVEGYAVMDGGRGFGYQQRGREDEKGWKNFVGRERERDQNYNIRSEDERRAFFETTNVISWYFILKF